VTPTELLSLLREFYVERLSLLMQHESAARYMTDYDINNAYQYVIAREETHISWLQHALLDVGATIPADPTPPEVTRPAKGTEAVRQLSENDGRANDRFVSKWRDRVEQVKNARHKGMLGVILGEMLEHKRLFEQAAQGRTDLIGTHLPINERRGKVLDTRWVE
jgi:Mn-containing catalase